MVLPFFVEATLRLAFVSCASKFQNASRCPNRSSHLARESILDLVLERDSPGTVRLVFHESEAGPLKITWQEREASAQQNWYDGNLDTINRSDT